MGTYFVAYGAASGAFLIADILWLSLTAQGLYRAKLGDLLLPKFRPAPAILFYLIYIAGIVGLAVLPALRQGSLTAALGTGLFFGFCAYATYDLTNLATLRNWSVTVTLIDLAWGAFATAVASGAAYLAVTLWLRPGVM